MATRRSVASGTEPALSDDLELGLDLVRAAARLALEHARRGVAAEAKADGSFVTPADVGIEGLLAEQLGRLRPGDALLGEELGSRGDSERRWIIDPIDGTSNYIEGEPQWGTHLALERAGEIVLGLISRPVVGKVWWATRGGGAYRGALASAPATRERIRVSGTRALASSRVAVWAERPHALIDRVAACATVATADLDAILRLVEGSIDAVIDPTDQPWDHAPATLLVEEAGGRFSDASNGRRIDRGEVRYSNGSIHEALVRALAS